MRDWSCLTCGARICRALRAAAEHVAKAEVPRNEKPVYVHVCGACKQFHFELHDGLRLPTAEEMDEMRQRYPHAMREIETMHVEPLRDDEPAAGAVLFERPKS